MSACVLLLVFTYIGWPVCQYSTCFTLCTGIGLAFGPVAFVQDVLFLLYMVLLTLCHAELEGFCLGHAGTNTCYLDVLGLCSKQSAF